MCKLHLSLAVLLVALVACKAETSIDDYPCPKEGTKLTYAKFGQEYLARSCQTCHGQASGDRKGAPSSRCRRAPTIRRPASATSSQSGSRAARPDARVTGQSSNW